MSVFVTCAPRVAYVDTEVQDILSPCWSVKFYTGDSFEKTFDCTPESAGMEKEWIKKGNLEWLEGYKVTIGEIGVWEKTQRIVTSSTHRLTADGGFLTVIDNQVWQMHSNRAMRP